MYLISLLTLTLERASETWCLLLCVCKWNMTDQNLWLLCSGNRSKCHFCWVYGFYPFPTSSSWFPANISRVYRLQIRIFHRKWFPSCCCYGNPSDYAKTRCEREIRTILQVLLVISKSRTCESKLGHLAVLLISNKESNICRKFFHVKHCYPS